MSLFEDASLIVTPNAQKAGKLYAIKPDSGAGDLTVTRATEATRVNSAGLIESVANNVPRLDYSNGSCPSILVEPQRTNLVLRSEEIDSASWSNFAQGAGTNPIITANYTLAPDGTLTADRIQCNSGSLGSPNRSARQQSVNITNGLVYALSFFVKSNTGINQNFSALNSAMNVNSGFNQQGVATPEWSRFVLVGTSVITGSNAIRIGLIDSLLSTTNDISIWGIQFEQGSNATSYIPTVASTVTRNADVISKTGISDLIGQSEGTLFVEFNLSTIGGLAGSGIIELTPAGGVEGESNRIIIYKGVSSKQIGFQIRAGGTTNIFNFLFSAPADGKVKVGIAYKSGDTILSVNGSIVARSETFTFSQTLNFIKLGASLVGNVVINDTINQCLLFKTRLSNAELIQLTTL
jgi:hypothetical protein